MRGEAGLPKYLAVGRKHAGIAQLGERQTEDLKVAGSIPAVGSSLIFFPSRRLGPLTAALPATTIPCLPRVVVVKRDERVNASRTKNIF